MTHSKSVSSTSGSHPFESSAASESPKITPKRMIRPQSFQGAPTVLRPSIRMAGIGLRRLQRLGLRNQLALACVFLLLFSFRPKFSNPFASDNWSANVPDPPLAMEGGDPYVRALMRTISVSESNDPNPYGLLYGGEHVSDLQNHPDRCIEIVAGPNTGNCSTAAGRYQFITSTWEEKAQQYHPSPDGWLFWQHYAFDPVSQDQVVYHWLMDPQAWGLDIPTDLRAGRLDKVLAHLSGTWTSLGYGIETNDMSASLTSRYQEFLEEERLGTQQ